MAEVAKRYSDELPRLKKLVETSWLYDRKNYVRYHRSRRRIFKSSITSRDRDVLKDTGKPDIEFNIEEAFMSRQIGEFAGQEPSLITKPYEDLDFDPRVLEVVDGHVRHFIHDFNKNGGAYEGFRDQLSGGMAVLKLWTEFSTPFSFQEVMKLGLAFDPTLCGFDPLSRLRTKADGRYAFELFPKRKTEFQEEHKGVDLSGLKFARGKVGEFNWSYSTQKEDILLICDLYEKKSKKVKIVQLANGKVQTLDDYHLEMQEWEKNRNIEQPPIIIDERETDIPVVCRYRFIENKMLEYVETKFSGLPLIRMDGNSAQLRDSLEGESYQMTRSFLYQTSGIQRLMNYSGQSLANELENTITHRFMIPLEAIPEEKKYLKAILNPQKPSTVVYLSYHPKDPSKKLDAPTVINRTPIPPEISATFMNAMQIMQYNLGSYDASLGNINRNQTSGEAIFQGTTNSNAAAKPFIMGYILALNAVANIFVGTLPKLYKKPRSIPVMGIDREINSVKINQKGGIKLDYPDYSLKVVVEAGVNFEMQKNRSQDQFIKGMSASQEFSAFVNDECLPEFLDTFDIRGIDSMKKKAEKWQEQRKIMQKQAMAMQQQQMMNNPMIMRNQLEQQKLVQNAQQNQVDNQLKASQMEIDKLNADNDRLKIMADLQQSGQENLIAAERLQTEKEGHAVDLAMKMADQHHQHTIDALDMHHSHTKEAVELHHQIEMDHAEHELNKKHSEKINNSDSST